MSEKTEPLEKLLQQMNDRLAELTEKVKSPPSEKLQSTEKHTHTKHSENIEFDCPECQKMYDAGVSAKAIKEYRENLKKIEKPVVCEDCGEIVEEEAEECPTCHGKKARKI